MSCIMHLVFASGGARALPYLGILRVPGIYDRVRVLDGTSAGALIALLLAIRVSYEDAFKLCTETLPDMFRLQYIVSFFGARGLFKWEDMRDRLIEALGEDMQYLTFHKLFQKTGVSLAVHAVDVVRHRSKRFSHRETPDVNVIDAVCASCCIPVLFTPVSIQGRLYVDGALRARFAETEDAILCIPKRIRSRTKGYFEQLFDMLRPVEPPRPPVVVRVPACPIDILSFGMRLMYGQRPLDADGQRQLHVLCQTFARTFEDETQAQVKDKDE